MGELNGTNIQQWLLPLACKTFLWGIEMSEVNVGPT